MSTRFKIAQTGTEARDRLIKGANFLADCVKSTLGPFGQNWLLEKDGGRITNDGVTVARDLMVRDEIENQGLRTLREASIKTNDQAGDGTTTAAVLAQAILHEAIKALGSSRAVITKITPADLLNKLNQELKEVIEKLKALSRPIESKEELIASALVSVENEELANLIGGTQWDLGPDGFILAKETAERQSKIELIRGVRLDNGLGLSLIMNNLEKQTLEAENCQVILTSHVVNSLAPLKKVGDQLAKMGKNKIVLVARGFGGEAIRDVMANAKNNFNFYPINAPYVDMNEVFKDLAAVTGATFFPSEGPELSDINISDVGYCGRILAGRYEAVITGPEDEQTKERVAARITELENQVKGEKSEFMKKSLAGRIAQLKNGFASLEVGAQSDVERKRLADKAEDAVNAVRAALQEGVVPGAGLAFKQIAEELPDGYLLKLPLRSIHDQIVSTAPAEWVVPEWVKDPTRVLRIALENAVSVAGTLATAAGVTAQERDKPRLVEEVKTAAEEGSEDK
jgi:chaperonin GroEL